MNRNGHSDLQAGYAFRLLALGDLAVTLEFSSEIDEAVNRRVIGFAEALKAAEVSGIEEIVTTYRSVTVLYDPRIISGSSMREQLRRSYDAFSQDDRSHRRFVIPVQYGTIENDLQDLATEKGLAPDDIISMHLAGQYRVYMIGFAPGFAYLGGLPEKLHTPRRPLPRQWIEAGAIGIGGKQASISSVAGPSGWHFVGRTPIRLFQPLRENPFLLEAGDEIAFRSIEEDEFNDIDRRISSGTFEIAELVA